MSAGSTIKTLRIKAGLSQQQLANKAGVAQAMISLYELEKSELKVLTFEKMLNAMGYELVVRRIKHD